MTRCGVQDELVNAAAIPRIQSDIIRVDEIAEGARTLLRSPYAEIIAEGERILAAAIFEREQMRRFGA